MPKTKPGELEEHIPLALLRLHAESCAVPVANGLSRATGREVS